MLSNAYFLAKFRFDTAENEPAKNLQNFRKMHFSKLGLFRALDWIGTLTFAVTGSALAGQYNMDLLGCVIVGSITAIGGGTIRDLLLGASPVFWVEEWESAAQLQPR